MGSMLDEQSHDGASGHKISDTAVTDDMFTRANLSSCGSLNQCLNMACSAHHFSCHVHAVPPNPNE
jgi:hypothetical protein